MSSLDLNLCNARIWGCFIMGFLPGFLWERNYVWTKLAAECSSVFGLEGMVTASRKGEVVHMNTVNYAVQEL